MKTFGTGRKSRLIFLVIAAVAVVTVVAVAAISRQAKSRTTQAAVPPAIPVTVTEAVQRDVPIYFHALGTVQASNTVALRAQLNGEIISINFRQGQEVRRGDVLARIDPAPYQAALDQAIAKKKQDEALLIAAQKDLVRFTTLATKSFETQQNVDAQQAKVDQLKATIDADQAAIEAARAQLGYTSITAPIDGVVGFRQVDIGNIIHTSDINPLTVLTQIKPSVAVFTLPQDDLGPVREAMLRGQVDILAFDQNDTTQLAQGRLLLIDNQIDQSTSTIRLKAEFPNEDEHLWPGQFVRIRILITTRKDAVTVPSVAVQRGPDGLFIWVIKPDDTAEQRPIEAQIVDDTTAVVSKGLAVGERVVLDGQSRLEGGSHVDIRPSSAAQPQPEKS
jgi:membrane fusion protein, multidrug efflux system